MTKYKYDICSPKKSGFYKVYDQSGCCYVGYFSGTNFFDPFKVGPKLIKPTKTEPLILRTDITKECEIYEWSEWDDE